MRDIAGQLNGDTFGALDAGVTGGVANAFRTAYTQVVADAVDRAGFFAPAFGAFKSATVDLAETRQMPRGVGTEHIGITVAGNAGALGALNDDLPLPSGASFGFAYSLDSFIEKLRIAWDILQHGVSNGRFNTNLQPDPSGEVTLDSMDFYGSHDGTQLRTVIKATYRNHDVPQLPAVPVTLTTTETGRVLPVAGDIHTITVGASVDLGLDTSAAETAIRIAESGASFLALGLLGFSGGGAIAGGVLTLQHFIQSKLAGIQAQPLALLPFVAALFPVRVLLPGTAERLVFPYDGFQVPQGIATADAPAGFGALAHIDAEKAEVFVKGKAFVAYGSRAPYRAPRVAILGIRGQDPKFPANPSRTGSRVSATYTAITNDEVARPVTFNWALTVIEHSPSTSATLSSTTGQSVTVYFEDRGVTPTPPKITVRLAVQMDDQLHLKDANGHVPTTSRPITVIAAATAPATTGGGGHVHVHVPTEK